jgi:asparagine N-glycosylation enzyme membrane subunit Stt3
LNYDHASAVAVDGSGNVVVTGSSYSSGGMTDSYTAKYAAADSALLWERRYNGPANLHDSATAVAVDGSGNVVVTGSSESDYYTAKYAAANGALLWEQRYNGPANNTDRAEAVSVDRSGNVVVTGNSYNGTNYDFYTVKYAAANGALLWERRYNGTADSNDYAYAVAVDKSGNAVVTGSSNDGTNDHCYTAKYDAADGTLLWERRYSGPTNGHGYASTVAVDGNGNVVIAGTSYDSGGNADYYTAKYAAADGALLWEKRYNSPCDGDDVLAFSRGFALGPNGRVAIAGSSATVVYLENLPPVAIALVPNGVRIRFTGNPGRSYTLERAPVVTGPWTTLATPTEPVGGLIEYVDTAPLAGAAFYRTSAPTD